MKTKRYLNYILPVIIGIFIGWLFFHPSRKDKEKHEQTMAESTHDHSAEGQEAAVWTCSMHPQIRMDKPGDCPICGMDLIPLSRSGSSDIDADAIHLSKDAAALANVLTSVVSRQKPVKEVRLYGKVQVDERLLQSQVAHVPGRIEKLFVNFTGETVKRGQVLAEIYSPELITAQQELLLTRETRQLQPELYEASREKLLQWKLTDAQINSIEASGKIINNFQVLSNTTGTVTALSVNTGDHVAAGTVLFEIADLSKVWILFEAYESDLQFLGKGKKITFSFQALPGKEYTGNISFIDPVIDPVTRVARVRVEMENRSALLKPQMFATGIVSSSLKEYSNSITIPRSAVLWTGKRSIVYVKQPGDEPVFKMREITLGPALGDSYVVTDGITEGEEIVTSGTFSVDASAQLEGKPSMMNPSGGTTSAGHQHGGTAGQQQAGIEQNPAGISKIDVSMDFVMQLNNVFDRYIDLKNALVSSNAEQAKKEAGRVREALSKADMKLLKGEAHSRWMDILDILNSSLDKIASSAQIDPQRNAFSDLSDNMYIAVKTFGLMDRAVYYQFCPMAKNNTGAYWLSETEDIRNPYFGEQMMTCGETREVLKN